MKLQGIVACKGQAEGFARIINSYGDLDDVKEGDILITAQTDMNYTPYLDICAGFITESGGRYSHASIYARENQKPCITNVKDARQLLNGNIFLDADKNEIYRK